MTNVNTKDFTLHENIFFQLVERQAGTMEKALLEACMNSVDAGSSFVNINITADKFQITDAGKGFLDDDEIKRYFSTVGTPHVEGDAHYGKYRMGRCQLFRWGINTWRSNTFRMMVDVKRLGIKHQVTRNLAPQSGCDITVDLYIALQPSEAEALESTLANWVAWTPIPVFINGKLASTNPAENTDWTIDDENAFVRLDTSTQMRVYNRGVFVASYGVSEFGSGGVIISKPQLDLVYARNAITTKCKVWKAIQKKVRALTMETTTKRSTTNEQRTYFCTQIMSGEMFLSQVYENDLRVITMMDGTHQTLNRMTAMMRDGLAIAAPDDQAAAGIHRNKLANVMSSVTLDRFGATSLETLIERMTELHSQEIRRANILAARNHTWTGENEILRMLRDSFEQLEKFKELDLTPYRKIANGKVLTLKTTHLPVGMRSYFRALEIALEHLNNVTRLSPIYSKTVLGQRSGSILLLNPTLIPNPADGIPAIMQTAAMMLQMCYRKGFEDDDTNSNVIEITNAVSNHSGVPRLAMAIIKAISDQSKQGNDSALKMRSEITDFAIIAQAQSSAQQPSGPH
jgi:hypothetical protein